MQLVANPAGLAAAALLAVVAFFSSSSHFWKCTAQKHRMENFCSSAVLTHFKKKRQQHWSCVCMVSQLVNGVIFTTHLLDTGTVLGTIPPLRLERCKSCLKTALTVGSFAL